MAPESALAGKRARRGALVIGCKAALQDLAELVAPPDTWPARTPHRGD